MYLVAIHISRINKHLIYLVFKLDIKHSGNCRIPLSRFASMFGCVGKNEFYKNDYHIHLTFWVGFLM
jgi:hypothetical protein